MLQTEKKYLQQGINADDAPFIVGDSELINASNHRFGTTEDGDIGYNQSVPGTALIPNGFLSDNLGVVIGTARDTEKKRIIYFYFDNTGRHLICCYDTITKTLYNVLRDAQVIGGLNFRSSSRINQGYVINGILYWTDDFNEPRRVNIEAGIKANHAGYATTVQPYTLPIAPHVLTVIKKTANLTVTVRKVQSIDIPAIATYTQNFIADSAFQFAVRLIYRDNEYSVVGAWSKLAPPAYANEVQGLNAIEVIYTEPVDQDVFSVELIVRFGNTGKSFVIKTWDRDHDPVTMQLGSFLYYFVNDGTGTPVDEVAAAKPFDSVPLKSKTLAIGRNRLFMGNNLLGYSAPVTTSLNCQLNTFPTSGGMIGVWHYFKVRGTIASNPTVQPYFAYVIYVDFGPGGGVNRYAYVKSIDLLFSNFVGVDNHENQAIPPSLVNLPYTFRPPGVIYQSDITATTDDLQMIEFWARPKTPEFKQPPYDYYVVTQTDPDFDYPSPVTVSTRVTASNGVRALKSDSAYRIGIVFYDKYRRKCGVVTNDNLKKILPRRPTVITTYNYYLQWFLSNTNALAEIPDWAYYYSIVRTKNLSYQNFIQGTPNDATYVTKDANGVYLFTTHTYAITHAGIGLKISELISKGIGYTYAEGDFATLWVPSFTNPIRRLKVIGQAGDWVVLSLDDVGNINDLTPIFFEIYTPHQENIIENYYEIGETYPVANPGTNTRMYTNLNGSINGDTYNIQRSGGAIGLNVVEAMSPNDRYWKNWYSDVGWINIIDRIGQQRRLNNVAWSNVLIPGTRTNGLSSFDPLDTDDTPVECGALNKLILASKVQDEGNVMLAICRDETVSLYLGEAQLTDVTGNSFIAISGKVIGTMNVLKGGYGTSHPESVAAWRGDVYWFDVTNGALVRYSSNGLFAISDYKMSKYFKKVAKWYLALATPVAIPGGVNPLSEEYLLTIPDLQSTPPTIVVPNLPTLSQPNEFGMFDAGNKIIVFKMGLQKVISSYPFFSDDYTYMDLTMFTFKQGNLYTHRADNVPDNFLHGEQHPTKLMFIANSLPTKPKVFTNIAIEGNMPPTHAIFYSDNPKEQITDLYARDFVFKEGVWYASLRRDRISPNTKGTPDAKLISGEKIRALALKCQLEFDVSTTRLQLKFVNITYHISEGHST